MTEQLTFHCFPQLPTENRQRIWCLYLQRRRLIPIRLGVTIWGREAEGGDFMPEADRNVQGYSIRTPASTREPLSPLLWVNSEAREAALRHYRIHLPCALENAITGESRKHRRGYRYINPEFDVIHLSFDSTHLWPMIRKFSAEMVTRDPLSVGLLNLAFGPESLMDGFAEKTKHARVGFLHTFMQAVPRLQNVYFITLHKWDNRWRLPDWSLSGFSAAADDFDVLPRGMSIAKPTEESFNVLDHRHSTLSLPYFWRELLEMLGVSAPDIQYHSLLIRQPEAEATDTA